MARVDFAGVARPRTVACSTVSATASTRKSAGVGRLPLWCVLRTQGGHRVRSEKCHMRIFLKRPASAGGSAWIARSLSSRIPEDRRRRSIVNAPGSGWLAACCWSKIVPHHVRSLSETQPYYVGVFNEALLSSLSTLERFLSGIAHVLRLRTSRQYPQQSLALNSLDSPLRYRIITVFIAANIISADVLPPRLDMRRH